MASEPTARTSSPRGKLATGMSIVILLMLCLEFGAYANLASTHVSNHTTQLACIGVYATVQLLAATVYLVATRKGRHSKQH